MRREDLPRSIGESRSDATEFQTRPTFTLDPDASFSASDYAIDDSPKADLGREGNLPRPPGRRALGADRGSYLRLARRAGRSRRGR